MGFLDNILGGAENITDKPLNEDDYNKLMDAKPNMVDRLIAIVPLTSGISLEEFANLKRRYVDRLSQSITVYNAQQKTTRVVYLPKSVMAELKYYIDHTDLSSVNDGEGTVVSFGRDAIKRRLSAHTTDVLGRPVSWKALRRTYVRRSARQGKSITLVAENSGLSLEQIQHNWSVSAEEKRKMVD